MVIMWFNIMTFQENVNTEIKLLSEIRNDFESLTKTVFDQKLPLATRSAALMIFSNPEFFSRETIRTNLLMCIKPSVKTFLRILALCNLNNVTGGQFFSLISDYFLDLKLQFSLNFYSSINGEEEFQEIIKPLLPLEKSICARCNTLLLLGEFFLADFSSICYHAFENDWSSEVRLIAALILLKNNYSVSIRNLSKELLRSFDKPSIKYLSLARVFLSFYLINQSEKSGYFTLRTILTNCTNDSEEICLIQNLIKGPSNIDPNLSFEEWKEKAFFWINCQIK